MADDLSPSSLTGMVTSSETAGGGKSAVGARAHTNNRAVVADALAAAMKAHVRPLPTATRAKVSITERLLDDSDIDGTEGELLSIRQTTARLRERPYGYQNTPTPVDDQSIGVRWGAPGQNVAAASSPRAEDDVDEHRPGRAGGVARGHRLRGAQ